MLLIDGPFHEPPSPPPPFASDFCLQFLVLQSNHTYPCYFRRSPSLSLEVSSAYAFSEGAGSALGSALEWFPGQSLEFDEVPRSPCRRIPSNEKVRLKPPHPPSPHAKRRRMGRPGHPHPQSLPPTLRCNAASCAVLFRQTRPFRALRRPRAGSRGRLAPLPLPAAPAAPNARGEGVDPGRGFRGSRGRGRAPLGRALHLPPLGKGCAEGGLLRLDAARPVPDRSDLEAGGGCRAGAHSRRRALARAAQPPPPALLAPPSRLRQGPPPGRKSCPPARPRRPRGCTRRPLARSRPVRSLWLGRRGSGAGVAGGRLPRFSVSSSSSSPRRSARRRLRLVFLLARRRRARSPAETCRAGWSRRSDRFPRRRSAAAAAAGRSQEGRRDAAGGAEDRASASQELRRRTAAAAAGRAGRPAERGVLRATTAEGKGRPGGSLRSCSCAAGPRDLPTMIVAGLFCLFLSLGECGPGGRASERSRRRPSASWTATRRGAAGGKSAAGGGGGCGVVEAPRGRQPRWDRGSGGSAARRERRERRPGGSARV